MEDLLIVRLADRSKSCYARRREPVPIGASLGLVLGAAFGLALASSSPEQPAIPMALGIAVGLAIGGLLGRFLKPRPRRQPTRIYDGLPFEPIESPDEKAS